MREEVLVQKWCEVEWDLNWNPDIFKKISYRASGTHGQLLGIFSEKMVLHVHQLPANTLRRLSSQSEMRHKSFPNESLDVVQLDP